MTEQMVDLRGLLRGLHEHQVNSCSARWRCCRWEEFVRLLGRPARDLPKLCEAAKLRERLLAS